MTRAQRPRRTETRKATRLPDLQNLRLWRRTFPLRPRGGDPGRNGNERAGEYENPKHPGNLARARCTDRETHDESAPSALGSLRSDGEGGLCPPRAPLRQEDIRRETLAAGS